MRKIAIILSVFAFVANGYGQAKIELREISSGEFVRIDIDNLFPLPYDITVRIAPDKSVVIDTIERTNIQQIVEEINTIQLRCDTINNEYGVLTRIYFDKENRLKKYSQIVLMESEGSNTIAYYNETGNLVYITRESYNNCDSSSEYFYLHNGQIVDFMGAYDCGCCEEEDLAEWEKGNITPPLLGSVLTKSITSHWISFANFVNANKLLTILKSGEYYKVFD